MGPWVEKRPNTIHHQLSTHPQNSENKITKFLASIKMKEDGRRGKMMKKKQVKLFDQEEIVLNSPMTEEPKLKKS